jgi:hypothetical protein
MRFIPFIDPIIYLLLVSIHRWLARVNGDLAFPLHLLKYGFHPPKFGWRSVYHSEPEMKSFIDGPPGDGLHLSRQIVLS